MYSERGALQVHSGGAHSRVKPHMASIFSDCGFDVVSVASNHAMDWGPDALLDTIELLREQGIKTVGAGRNLAEAREPAFIERNGIRVAFLAYCSVLHEGYAADSGQARASRRCAFIPITRPRSTSRACRRASSPTPTTRTSRR